MSPTILGLRKAMQQHERRALSLFGFKVGGRLKRVAIDRSAIFSK